MILVLASERNPGAAALVAGWAGARLLTPADLALPGWELAAGPPSGAVPAAGRGVADGVPFHDAEVGCVVSLLAGVEADELTWIDAPHRAYVAAETTAFLGFWLTGIGERCLVRPSHASLAGPYPAVTDCAAAAGLPLATAAATDDEPLVVTVVGNRALVVGRDDDGAASARLPAPVGRQLVQMAAHHGTPLLTAVLLLTRVDGGGQRFGLHAVLPAPLVGTPSTRTALRALVSARLAAAGPAAGVAS